jgi:hypothetical protein
LKKIEDANINYHSEASLGAEESVAPL